LARAGHDFVHGRNFLPPANKHLDRTCAFLARHPPHPAHLPRVYESSTSATHPTPHLCALPAPSTARAGQPTMASNGVQHVFAPVLAAHNTMSSGADRAQKEQAHQFLEQFQKSV
jgi:hypothetical protein